VACWLLLRIFCGTKFPFIRITNQRLPDTSKRQAAEMDLEAIMDAKWNKVIDKLTVRMALLVVGFGAWFAISYSLLAF